MYSPNQTRPRASTCLLILISSLLCTLAACNSDTRAPSVSLSTSGSSLPLRDPIVLLFSESMNTASLVLGGTLAGETDGGVWSTTTYPNDTLTLTPVNGDWNGGASQTLTVDARDVSGNQVPTINRTYQAAPLAFDNFQAAEVVIGQTDFTVTNNNTYSNPDANTLSVSYGNPAVAPDGRLFIGDFVNDRVLAFAQVPTVSNANASFVLGQPNFTTTNPGAGQGGHDGPQQVVISNGKMFVVDYHQRRVVIYNTIPADGSALPDVVVGQPNFNSISSGCTDSLFEYPETVSVTPDGKLVVTDGGNSRVMIWNSIPTTNGQPADLVLGQSDFTHCAANDDNQDMASDTTPTARTLRFPGGSWTDGTRLAILDGANNRVLIWNTFPTSNFQPADLVLGQGDFTHGTLNDDNQDGTADPTPTPKTLNGPYAGIDSNGTQLAVTDAGNNRVLIWNTFPTTNFQPADIVLGQSDFTHGTGADDDQDNVSDPNTSARAFDFPSGVLFYRDRLLVTDASNFRVLIFRSN
ncbi:MAG: hypothetical protein KJ798_13735 [Gammaproteobacteria bacterium]|nr:hypothetical protein [Gammaproteobacteria bacterium]MBU0849094.1 hypothetical protein [Gammaproteobacteria bacterium]MBU1268416.1 hypothetical protein [Gammaproteobacteria bacterium]MBU1529600.1 hypothetical protein [Gammaproteobacteria bacterium]MBU1781431.1 hypothetical protein [Gammaproteobacteria bacterium]